MLPIFRSTPFNMSNDQPDRQWVWKWSLLASFVVHLLVAALIMPRSPVSPPKEEQEITVELVQVAKPPAKTKTQASPPANRSKLEKPQAGSAEIPSPTNGSGAQQVMQPALKPVFLFGDKDRGPRRSPDGNSAESGSASPAAQPDPAKQSFPQTLAVTTAATDHVPQSTPTKTPTPTSEGAAQTQQGLKLQEAKALFSQEATSDLSSMVAMGSMPRGERAGQLCLTELREQLLHATPAYFPDLLPLERLQEGTLLEVSRTAFRSNSQWYDLSYRCEVNAQATKVMTFAFQVGEPVPRSNWKSRGFPSQ
jgi:hypothetical protein